MHKEKSALGFGLCLSLLETLSLASMVTVVGVVTLDLPAQAALLTKWRFDPAANQLEITLQEGTTPRYFLLAQPPRIVLDLPNTKRGKVETQQTYSGAVRQIRVAQFQPDVTRIVLELSKDVVLKPEQVELRGVAASGNRWVLRPLIASFQTPALRAYPDQLPPATFPKIQTSLVKVPPLNRPSAEPTAPAPVTNLPPATFASNQKPSINTSSRQSSTSQTSVPAATTPVIEFGQPLPKTKPNPTMPTPQTSAGASPALSTMPEGVPTAQTPELTLPVETAVMPRTSATPTVVVPPLNRLATTAARPTGNSRTLLSAGTLLTLRYPGNKVLTLQAGYPRPEVLLLQEALRDRTGNIIAPAGTPVIGRFETDSRGSRFIVQAITLDGRNIPLAAQSNSLDRNRQVSPNQILQVQLKEDLR